MNEDVKPNFTILFPLSKIRMKRTMNPGCSRCASSLFSVADEV